MTRPFPRPADLAPINPMRIAAAPDRVVDVDLIDCSAAEPLEWADRSGVKKAKTRLVRKYTRTGIWSMS